MVELKGIKFGYKNKNVLNNLDLKLDKGTIVGLLAPNGEGKSTLIKLLAGINTSYIGEYIFYGKKFNYKNKGEIGYLADKPIIPSMWTVKDALNYYNKNFDKFSHDKAIGMINDFNIDINSVLEDLSKGKIEKVHLALALSIKAKLYILDEPLSSIDIITKEQILKTILNNFDEESIILITSHLLSDIERIIDKAILLKDGVIIKDEYIDDLRANGMNLVSLYREVFA